MDIPVLITFDGSNHLIYFLATYVLSYDEFLLYYALSYVLTAIYYFVDRLVKYLVFNVSQNIHRFFPIISIDLYPFPFKSDIYYGGGNINRLVSPVLLKSQLVHHDKYGHLNPLVQYRFVKYLLHINLANRNMSNTSCHLLCRFFLSEVFNWLNVRDIRMVAQKHGIKLPRAANRNQISKALVNHICDSCFYHTCIFEETMNKVYIEKIERPSHFPPPPLSNKLAEKIINGFCAESDPLILQEAGCSVCGCLCRISDLLPLDNYKGLLNILIVKGITRQERKSDLDTIEDINGPILDNKCSHICFFCAESIQQHTIPLNSLANSLWIGDIPSQLQNLSFAERMMIARIRHNKCLLRVSSGRAKMTANVIMYSNPTLKIYHSLPPSKEEMNEVLAFVFTGPSQPTDEDFKRCPMLVRRQKV